MNSFIPIEVTSTAPLSAYPLTCLSSTDPSRWSRERRSDTGLGWRWTSDQPVVLPGPRHESRRASWVTCAAISASSVRSA